MGICTQEEKTQVTQCGNQLRWEKETKRGTNYKNSKIQQEVHKRVPEFLVAHTDLKWTLVVVKRAQQHLDLLKILRRIDEKRELLPVFCRFSSCTVAPKEALQWIKTGP